MAAGEQGQQDLVEHVGLADERPLDFAADGVDAVAELAASDGGGHGGGGGHRRNPSWMSEAIASRNVSAWNTGGGTSALRMRAGSTENLLAR